MIVEVSVGPEVHSMPDFFLHRTSSSALALVALQQLNVGTSFSTES